MFFSFWKRTWTWYGYFSVAILISWMLLYVAFREHSVVILLFVVIFRLLLYLDCQRLHVNRGFFCLWNNYTLWTLCRSFEAISTKGSVTEWKVRVMLHLLPVECKRPKKGYQTLNYAYRNSNAGCQIFDNFCPSIDVYMLFRTHSRYFYVSTPISLILIHSLSICCCFFISLLFPFSIALFLFNFKQIKSSFFEFRA